MSRNIAGVWLFSGGQVAKRKIEAFAAELGKDSCYTSLIVRATRDGIGLQFIYHDSTDLAVEEAQDELIRATTPALRREFGDMFLGWDIGSPAIPIYRRGL